MNIYDIFGISQGTFVHTRTCKVFFHFFIAYSREMTIQGALPIVGLAQARPNYTIDPG